MICSILVVASPVGGICPIHVLVSEHQGIYGVPGSEDGQRGSDLRIENRVRNVFVTLKDMPVLQQDLQTHLRTQSSTVGDMKILLKRKILGIHYAPDHKFLE